MNNKEKAFAFFDQGLNATSPEVKGLGLKTKTRSNYYWEWRQGQGGKGKTSTVRGAEVVGTIDETKQGKKVIPSKAEILPVEKEEKEVEEVEKEVEEVTPEKQKEHDEVIGTVSEAVTPKRKDGKPEPERKIATMVADEGIKCIVYLSLPTLTLYTISAATQANLNGEEPLLLGDFIDTCVKDYFSGRGKELGLIIKGGK